MELHKMDLVDAGIPEEFFDAAYKDIKNETLKETVAKFVKKRELARTNGYGLFLVGPNYCGKSYSLAVLAKILMEFDYSVKWVSVQDLNALSFGEETVVGKYGTLNDLFNPQFLIIDPFITEVKPFPKVLEFLNTRLVNRKSILTSATDQIEKLKFSQTLTSRLLEKNAQVVVKNATIYRKVAAFLE